MAGSITSSRPLHVLLDLTRARNSGDPFGFHFEPQEYLLRGPDGTTEGARFEWDDPLLERLHALQRGQQAPETLRSLGATLAAFIERAGWRERERAIEAHLHAGGRARVTIRSSAAELFALPWELLPLRGLGLSLGEHPDIVLRYEWPGTRAHARPAARARPRLLLAWSDAGGELPLREHRDVLAALRADAPRVQINVLEDMSLARLAETLDDAARAGQPFTALHLLGHGAREGETFGVASGPPGAREFIDPAELARVLIKHAGSLRLVILAVCNSSDPGALGSQLGSAAQLLHRAGVEAVVGSRFPLSFTGATRLAATLHRALLVEERPLEDALLELKQALIADATHLDWASLQFYAHALEEADHEDAPIEAAPAPARPSLAQPVWAVAALLIAIMACATLVALLRPSPAPADAAAPVTTPSAELPEPDEPAPPQTVELRRSGGQLEECDEDVQPERCGLDRLAAVRRALEDDAALWRALSACVNADPERHGVTKPPVNSNYWQFVALLEARPDGELSMVELLRTTSSGALPTACLREAFAQVRVPADAGAPTFSFTMGVKDDHHWPDPFYGQGH